MTVIPPLGNMKTSAPIGPTNGGAGGGGGSVSGTPSSAMTLEASDDNSSSNNNQHDATAAWIPLKLLPQKLAEIQQRNTLLVQLVQQQAHDISALATEVEAAVPHMACLEQQWLASQQQKAATMKEAATQTVAVRVSTPPMMNNTNVNNNKTASKGTAMETPARAGTTKSAKPQNPSNSVPSALAKNNKNKKNKKPTNGIPSNPSPTSVATFPSVLEFPPLVPTETALKNSPEKKAPISLRPSGDGKPKQEAWLRALEFLLDMGYSQSDIEAARVAVLEEANVNHQDLLANDNGEFVDAIIAWIEDRPNSEMDLCSLSGLVSVEEGNLGSANKAPSESWIVVGNDGATQKKSNSNMSNKDKPKNKPKNKNDKTNKQQANKAAASPSRESDIDADEIERLSREAEERARRERQVERARQEEEQRQKTEQEQSRLRMLAIRNEVKEEAIKRKTYRSPAAVDISGGESTKKEPMSSSNSPKPQANDQQEVTCKVSPPLSETSTSLSDVGDMKESTLAPMSVPSKTNDSDMDIADCLEDKAGSSSIRQASLVPVETGKLSQFLFPSSSSSSDKKHESNAIFEKLQNPVQVELARKLIRLESEMVSQKKEVHAKCKARSSLEAKMTKLEQEKLGLKEALKAKIEVLERPLKLEEKQLEQLEPRRYYEAALAQVQFLRAQPLAKWCLPMFEEQEKAAEDYLARYDEVESKRAPTAELVKAARAESKLAQIEITSQIEKLQREMTELEGVIEQASERLERLRKEISEGKGDGSFEDPRFDINNSRNVHGLTFLMVCTQNNDLETAQLCFELGAQVDVKCPRGLTALSYAKILQHRELITFLSLHGGSDPVVSKNSWEQIESVSGGNRMSWDTQLQIAERAAEPADTMMSIQRTSTTLVDEESTDTSGVDQSCFDASLIDPSSCPFRRVVLMDNAVFEWTQSHVQDQRCLIDVIHKLRQGNAINYHRSFIVGVKKRFVVRIAGLLQNGSRVKGEDTVVFYSPFVESFVDGVTNVGVLLWALGREDQAEMYKNLIECSEFRRHKVDNQDDHFPSHKAHVVELGKNMHLVNLKGTMMAMTLLKINMDEEQLERLFCAGFTPNRRMLDEESRLSNAINLNQESAEHSGLLSKALQAPDKSTNITGAAGTGKTLYHIKKLINEDASKKVLFLSRLPRLVAFVRSEVMKERDLKNLSFKTYEDLLAEMARSIEPKDPKAKKTFPAFSHVNFSGGNAMVGFEDSFVSSFLQAGERLRMKKSSVKAVTLWEAIRVIKSSAHCAKTKEPLTRQVYQKLPKSYGLTFTQRDLVYDLFQRYETWMSSRSLWDEADRVLYIFRFGASVFSDTEFISWQRRTNEMGETGLEGGFYDAVCCDEAQDFSELDLSLFIRMASSVRSLFIGADPAQSVEIGVRMRVGTVNGVFRSALDDSSNVKDVLQYLSLKTNYRAHAKNVALAQSIRKILSRSFGVPSSAENAIFEGPLPKALRLGSIEELPAKFCAADTVFICCDEVLDEVRSTFTKIGLKNDVLGVRESKGLEFPSVACIGFFSFFENAGYSRQWENVLRWLFSKKSITATDSTEKYNGKVLENCDYVISHPELENQAMLLYTAVTRCKGQLHLVEVASGLGFKKTTKGQSLAEFAHRLFNDLRLLQIVNSISEGGPEMTPQQHKARGVLLVVQAISMSRTAKSDVAVRKKFEEAADRFSPDKGNDQHLLDQCLKHLEAITMKRALRQFVKDKFFRKGRYDLNECFADILQFEQDTMDFLELALNDSFLVDEVQDHRLLMEEVFYGSPYEAHFAELCDRLKKIGA